MWEMQVISHNLRRCEMNWLDEIVKQHVELESPESFWRWAALAAISAVVKDSVWMDRQIFKTYPNIYVMLHADSGLKKGPPINMAKQLVQPLQVTKVISGRSSIQGILKDMGTAQSAPGGKVTAKSVAFICSSELSSSIVEDKVATTILTDLYDRSYNVGEWRSLLKMETFQLKDPTITMLTATNEAMSEDFFTKSAIQGGYFARTFIIYEKESLNSNSLIYPMENKPDYAQAGEYLKELSLLKGPFAALASLTYTDEYRFERVKPIRGGTRTVYFNEAGFIYDEWYDNFKKMVKDQEMKDDTGTLNRFGDSVLKVAMLMALADKPELVITAETMLNTITSCERLIGNVRRTTMGKQGLSTTSTLKSAVIMELLNRDTHQVTRTMLMKKTIMHYSSTSEFDDMMLSFDQSGMIKTTTVANQILYSMPDSQVNELKKFMSGKTE
jgi:hypothetical protein